MSNEVLSFYLNHSVNTIRDTNDTIWDSINVTTNRDRLAPEDELQLQEETRLQEEEYYRFYLGGERR